MAYGLHSRDLLSQDIHPYLAAMMFTHTGHPTLGRRYMGFGASPFYAGGPVPVHRMNRHPYGLQAHGMSRSLHGAGEYPFPQHPFPLGYGSSYNPWMGWGWSALGAGGLTPPNHSNSITNSSWTWPGRMMGSSSGGSGLGGTSSPGSMSGISDFSSNFWTSPYMTGFGNFMSGGLPRHDDGDDEDDDDDGAWDPDSDEDDPFASYLRAVKQGRKNKGKSMSCMSTNAMFGMPSMGSGMCIPPGCM